MKKRTLLIVFGLLFASIVLCGLLFHFFTKSMFLGRVDTTLRECNDDIAAELEAGREVQFQASTFPAIRAYLLDQRGNLVWISPASESTEPPLPRDLVLQHSGHLNFKSETEGALRALVSPLVLPTDPGVRLVVYRSVQSWQESVTARTRGTVLITILLFVLVGLIAKWALDRSFGQLLDVSHTLEQMVNSQDYRSALPRGEATDHELRSILDAIDSLQARLEGLNETIRRTLVGVSHELRNPLTVVTADLDLLRKDLPPEMREEVVGDTQKAVSKMTALVTDLLLLLRAESRSDSFPLSPIEVDELLETVVHKLQSKHPKAKIVLLEPEPNSPPLMAKLHREMTERILTDLISNGILYSRSEEVQVSVFRGEGSQVVISVKDSGCGIDEIHHEKLFEQFYRLESSRDRTSGGVGLGLPLARALARAQNGDLILKSRLGEGTEVQILFPSVEAQHEIDT